MRKPLNGKSMADLVLSHLLTGKTLSGVEAAALWRCRDLPKRVSELKKKGYDILVSYKKDTTGQRYARYMLGAFDAAIPRARG